MRCVHCVATAMRVQQLALPATGNETCCCTQILANHQLPVLATLQALRCLDLYLSQQVRALTFHCSWQTLQVSMFNVIVFRLVEGAAWLRLNEAICA